MTPFTNILRYSRTVQMRMGEWKKATHLSSMCFTFRGEKTLVTCAHSCETLADEIWLLVRIRTGEDVSDCSQVCRQ